MKSLPIGEKYASPYNSKVQEHFPPMDLCLAVGLLLRAALRYVIVGLKAL